MLDERQRAQNEETQRTQAVLERGLAEEAKTQQQVDVQYKRDAEEEERSHGKRQKNIERQTRRENLEAGREYSKSTCSLESQSYTTSFVLSSAILWTLLITILIACIIHDASGRVPSQMNYRMFAAVVSWICIGVGMLARFLEVSDRSLALFLIRNTSCVLQYCLLS